MRHVIIEKLEGLVRTDGEGSNLRQSKSSSKGMYGTILVVIYRKNGSS